MRKRGFYAILALSFVFACATYSKYVSAQFLARLDLAKNPRFRGL